MIRRITIILLASCFANIAMAQDASIKLDGEIYIEKFTANPPNGQKLMEFFRKSETPEKWTRLVGVRYQELPALGNEPEKVAQSMGQIVKATNPKANYRIIVNEQSAEAVINFLTWPPSGEYLEFNVFRYVKSSDGKGVVSLQFANRFAADSTPSVEEFKSQQNSWITQAANFDMTIVHNYLNK